MATFVTSILTFIVVRRPAPLRQWSREEPIDTRRSLQCDRIFSSELFTNGSTFTPTNDQSQLGEQYVSDDFVALRNSDKEAKTDHDSARRIFQTEVVTEWQVDRILKHRSYRSQYYQRSHSSRRRCRHRQFHLFVFSAFRAAPSSCARSGGSSIFIRR